MWRSLRHRLSESSSLLPSKQTMATITFIPLLMYLGFSILSLYVCTKGTWASVMRMKVLASSTSCGSPKAALPIAHWYVLRGAWLLFEKGIRAVLSEWMADGWISMWVYGKSAPAGEPLAPFNPRASLQSLRLVSMIASFISP